MVHFYMFIHYDVILDIVAYMPRAQTCLNLCIYA